MATSNVLVLDIEGGVSDQIRRRPNKDIDFSYATLVLDAKKVLCEKNISVALIVFNSSRPLRQGEAEQLISCSSATEWIAIVEPKMLECHEFQSFLLCAFHDHHTLPLDSERLFSSIGHACGRARIRMSLKEKNQDCGKFDIEGTSAVMNVLFQRLEKIINTDFAVLIGGETGTGKELVSQAIHKYGRRSQGPMVAVNCGAIPSHLIQSELFGHEKGAFTGAFQRKIGKIESSDGGILFLDEIGDLPMDMQSSLLRVLQERAITRVGSLASVPVDFRIIAATHIDLHEAITLGQFREDLYYRLNVMHLDMPPLRKRKDDIVLLAESIFRKHLSACKNPLIKGFSKDALRALSVHEWPGNVRELINRIQRAMVLSENRLLSPADLGLDSITRTNPRLRLGAARASLDRDIVVTSLQENNQNISQSAYQLGVSRVTLYRMMDKLKIPRDRLGMRHEETQDLKRRN